MVQDPPVKNFGDEDYYNDSAKLLYFKEKLREKLRSKNPEAFDKMVGEVGGKIRSNYEKNPGKSYEGVGDFVETYDFKEYLSPDEIKSTLGKEYDDYVETLNAVKSKGFAAGQGAWKLFGANEEAGDVTGMAFGKRFATFPLRSGITKNTIRDGKSMVEDTTYEYDPKAKKVNKLTVYK